MAVGDIALGVVPRVCAYKNCTRIFEVVSGHSREFCCNDHARASAKTRSREATKNTEV